MDVDEDHYTRINKAYTEADKRKFRQEGRCFECHKQGHMARECPNKKRQPFQSKPPYINRGNTFQQWSKPQYDRKPQYSFQKTKRFPPRPSHARTAYIEEIDEDDSDKEKIPPDDDFDIPSIAARTAKFSEAQREAWVKEMVKKHNMDFS